MNTFSVLYAPLVAVSILLGGTVVHAAPTNSDEAALGAAAIVVLAQKCAPQKASYYQTQAHNHLSYMLQNYSKDAKDKIFDELKTRVNALRVSASSDNCQGATRLHSLAYHYGYEHLWQAMSSTDK